jgi:hypothetical protein
VPVWEVVVERNQVSHTLRASAEQVWPITMAVRRFNNRQPLPFRTASLTDIVGSPRWKLVTVNPTISVPLDRDAILHGGVFGDGMCHRQAAGSGRSPFCQIYLCNDPKGCDSRKLAPLFQQHGFRPVVRDDRQQVRFYGLPASWKTLPAPTAPGSYLRGFVAGWFAADGHVDPRAPVALLACERREPLEWLQHIAPRAGLAVSTTISLRRSISTFGPSQWYSIGLAASTLDPEFFLLPEKRARYRAARFVKHWKVVTVRPTTTVESVHSLLADGGNFTIEGNILVTSN